MKQIHSLRLLQSLLFIGVLAATSSLLSCDNTVDGLQRDSPPLPPGNQFISVSVATITGGTVSDYTVAINGPDGTSSTTSSLDVFAFGITKNGNYTVEISKDGFVGQTQVIEITDFPEQASDDYSRGTLIILTPKNPTVTIDNATGGQITVPAMGGGTTGVAAFPTTVIIPAGALPTTSADISVTIVPPVAGSGESFGIHFEPDGLTFVTPITVQFPVSSEVGSGELYSAMRFENSNEEQPITYPNTTTASVSIPHFSTWYCIMNLFLNITPGTVKRVLNSSCGEGINQAVQTTGSYGPITSDLLMIPAPFLTISATAPAELVGKSFFRGEASVTFFTFSYSLISGSTSLETKSNIPVCPQCYSIDYAYVPCHDSGGG